MNIEQILVGVDFRQPSLAAARWAAAHFGHSAALELLHVAPVPELPRFLRPVMPVLDDRMEPVGAPVPGLREFAATLRIPAVATQVQVGPRVQRLTERAARLPADLVVLGRGVVNGHRGRTLERMVRHLQVPALVVGGRAQGWPRRILAAVDDAAIGRSVAQWAGQLAQHFGAELFLLHLLSESLLAYQPGESASLLMHQPQFSWSGRCRRFTEAWLQGMMSDVLPPGVSGQAVVGVGHPGPAIMEQVEALGADLLVLGRNGSDAVGASEIGSATRILLRGSPVPVLIVPADRARRRRTRLMTERAAAFAAGDSRG